MKIVIRLFAAAVMASALCACATVTRGTTTQFNVESTPPGAAVKTSNGFSCAATPCTFKMPRKEAFQVTVSKKGFKDATASINSEISGAGAAGLAGNVIAGGIIGMGIDATSGALNDLKPNPLQVTLAPVEVAAQPTAEAAPAPTATAAPASFENPAA
jgi:uncharacterized protein YcfJ